MHAPQLVLNPHNYKFAELLIEPFQTDNENAQKFYATLGITQAPIDNIARSVLPPIALILAHPLRQVDIKFTIAANERWLHTP